MAKFVASSVKYLVSDEFRSQVNSHKAKIWSLIKDADRATVMFLLTGALSRLEDEAKRFAAKAAKHWLLNDVVPQARDMVKRDSDLRGVEFTHAVWEACIEYLVIRYHHTQQGSQVVDEAPASLLQV